MKHPKLIAVNFVYRSRTGELVPSVMKVVYVPQISMRRNHDNALKICSSRFKVYHFESVEFKY